MNRFLRGLVGSVAKIGLMLCSMLPEPLAAQEQTPPATEVAAGRAGTTPSSLVDWSGKRVPYTDVPTLAQKNRLLLEYEKLRVGVEPTAETHWSLAQYCGKHGLKEQQRAHLLAVVAREPDHYGARAALGQKFLDGAWLTAAEQKSYVADKHAVQEARRRWEAPLKRIVAETKTKDPARTAAAIEELRRVNDPMAIPNLERIVSPAMDPKLGLAVVEVVRAMPDRTATMSLARHSAYHRSETVRDAAARALRDRTLTDFVPAMLGELLTAVESHTVVSQGLGGVVVYQTFVREGEAERQEALVATAVNVRGGDSNERTRGDDSSERTRAQAVATARQVAEFQTRLAEIENERTKFMNARICTALAIATGEDTLPADPEKWWEWWNEKNELYQSEKSVRRKYVSNEITVTLPRSRGRDGKCDCLAAGTEIVTARGPIAIEALRVGDLVLAQDPTTGNLAYKPVIATTIRPSGILTRITTDQGEYLTSGGHPLSIVGRSWEKSRDIKAGESLRGLEHDAKVSLVEEAHEAPTYNIVVADYHNYFAGPAKILSHDNTLCASLANTAVRRPADRKAGFGVLAP